MLINNPVIVAVLSILICIFLLLPIYFIIKKRKNGIFISLYVLILVFALRSAVAFTGEFQSVEDLNGFEKICDSLIHSLQTFSMDEDYTSYTIAGKTALNNAGYTSWATAYGFLISILNILSPVLGGALLLDILTGIIPSLKILLHPFKEKYVFSNLNEMSIHLAEDIDIKYNLLNPKSVFKPLIIFTGISENEKSSELIDRAKKIGVVYIKTNLLNLSLSKSRKVTYLLMNEKTEDNITAFSELMESENYPVSKNETNIRTKIFVTVHEDYESNIIKECMNRYHNNKKVIVKVIRDYMNTAINLMHDVPLFMPLLAQQTGAKDKIFITIIGDGDIACEVFKAVYWCGQMPDIKLYVNIISQNPQKMKKRLEESCPEMIECCDSDSLLQVYPFVPNKKINPRYIEKLSFIQVDDTDLLSNYNENIWKDTHYYVIALDSSKKNASLASSIYDKMKKMNLIQSCPEYIDIVPAIFNTSLAKTIKINKKEDKIKIIPFATFEERFSCKNVFMADFTKDSISTENLYNETHQIKIQNDEYTYWANIAKTIHAPYKLFALGLLGLNNDGNYFVKENTVLSANQKEKIAWIEHRRWNAFLRTQGFICPTKEQFDAYFKITKKHKNIDLKLHPCLVESDIGAKLLPDSVDFDRKQYDYLDYAGMYIYHISCIDKNEEESGEGLKKYDYKQWDYVQYDTAVQNLLK